MSKCCDTENPLIRDGVSQNQRQVKTLLPDSVKVDERKLADFLVFAHHLSKKVKYYTEENSCDGNWQEFFAYSTPVIIATIIKQQPKNVQSDYAAQLKRFLRDPSDQNYTCLLNTLTSLFDILQKWYARLENYTPLKSTIKGLVKTNLGTSLVDMWWTIEYAWRGDDKKSIYTEFNQKFYSQSNSEQEAASPSRTSRSKASSSELKAIFSVLFQTYQQIVQKAPQFITHSLIARQDHQPHLSLYVAFWQIFQLAQDDLNRMTQRHLDFFYRDVLRLPKRAAVPDRAHIIFELAKLPKNSFRLNPNTLFKAGKDASGVEIFYKLDEEIVVHKAQIASLKGLFLDSEEIATGNLPQNLRGLSASPVANSFDGKCQDFPKDQSIKAWLPFGNEHRDPVTYPANLGIAIASDVLLLQEGKRTITLELTLKETQATLSKTQLTLPQKFSNLSQTEKLLKLFKVNFSGKEGWIEVEIDSVKRTTSAQPDTYLLTLVIELSADQSPVIPYSADVHGSVVETEKPVILLRINAEESSKIDGLNPYHFLRSLELTDLTVTTAVNGTTAVEQVRNLVLQNDLAIINPTKPFQPFGPRPIVGSTFYIGSQEIFQKNLSSLKLAIEWEGLPNDGLAEHYRGYYVDGESIIDDKNNLEEYFSDFSVKVERLTKSIWSAEGLTGAYNFFDTSGKAQELLDTKQILPAEEEIDTLTDFNLQSSSGFLRFTLNQDLFHDEFPSKYAVQVLASAKDFNNKEYVNGAVYEVLKKPESTKLKRWKLGEKFDCNESVAPVTLKEPYTPTIRSISLSYTAVASKQECQLFYLYPFDGFQSLDNEKTDYLLPQFTNEGELLIGLKNLEPLSALPLLFQVAEETADTNLFQADVEWYYLKDNTWQKFQDHQIVSDTTKGLIASGIIKIAIPADISKAKTTILDRNLYWLKASVPARSKAICHMIGVHTQAAQVTFTDKGNDPQRLLAPLPAETITKLAEPKPQIKKIEQPYDSFDGEVKEQAAHFYTRISEHLRHKGRAVTIFDYERLVLEAFPQIYKVRCINHGQLGNEQFLELAPGSVALVVIPDLSQLTTTNNLEPKVNINLLHQIKEYLGKRSSLWVKDAIQVVNPKYEFIQVEFQVQFKEPYEDNFDYYRQKLDRAIVSFLAPWTSDRGAEIYFEGKIYRSSILKFIEEQSYVDYVLNFMMHHDKQQDVREAIASTPRSVLTSFSEKEGLSHIIQKIST